MSKPSSLVAAVGTVHNIMAIFSPIVMATTKSELDMCQERLLEVEAQVRTSCKPMTRQDEILLHQIALFMLLFDVCMCDITSPGISVDKNLAEMLELVQADLRLSGYREKLLDELGQQHEAVQDPNIRSYLGPLGLIAKRAHNMTITLQAFDLMSLHRWVRR